MKELKSPQELKDILTSKEPVAIFFYMEMCPHCKVMHEPWSELENKKGGVTFVKVESENIPSEVGVSGFPEFRLMKDGKVQKKVSGRMGGEELKSALFGGGGRSLRKTHRIRNTFHRSSRRSVSLRVKLRSTRKSRR
jgi:thiol-disulfide isomerase/thioredoxin